MSRILPRRRFLSIAASGAAAGAGAIGASALGMNAIGASAFGGGGGAGDGEAEWAWTGTALGADARMRFANCRREAARRAIRACRAEIARLEAIFSLYDPSSEISRLNRDGILASPSRDLVALMRLSRWFSERTGGAFDCTIQPLWIHLARHFGEGPNRSAPDSRRLRALLRRVDYGAVEISGRAISLPAGSAVTLNGVAQGYVTDRVAELLRAAGWADALVELGEIRALEGESWPVSIASGRARASISGAAMAASAGAGTPLDASGEWHHLLDPRIGRSRNRFASVTVSARRAAFADALSTALAVAAPSEIDAIRARFPAASVWLEEPDGRVRRI